MIETVLSARCYPRLARTPRAQCAATLSQSPRAHLPILLLHRSRQRVVFHHVEQQQQQLQLQLRLL